ncbi:MAG: NAD(P)/FAD-dependent oxidoreductase [Geminicoccaceae bacterium]
MGGDADVVVVGAGIAGASLAFELAADCRVVLLEREDRPGYHSTGRSAAMLIESYGTDGVRGLTKASRPFFERPPDGFSDVSLLSPRGYMHIAREDQFERLSALERKIRPHVPSLRRLSGAGVVATAPLIDPSYVAAGLLEPNAMAIDDAALHQGFLRGFAKRGGSLMTDADVQKAIPGAGGTWSIETRAGRFEAPVMVNAAGAWADELAKLSGVRPVGLQPKRRTAILLDPPDVNAPPSGGGGPPDGGGGPMINDVDEEFYVKPDGGALMVSPADETPSPPTDAQPEELDVAIAVDRYERLTGRPVKTIRQRWAGLRSFVSDHNPVIGFDDDVPGFFWLAGQGGFGIMTAPGAARLAADLIRERRPSGNLENLLPALSPGRRGLHP